MPPGGRLSQEKREGVDTLVLAMPISWKGTLQQYAGRLHREHADELAEDEVAPHYVGALRSLWTSLERT